MISNQSQHWF